ncbi:MAG: PRC-barrel domain-containing protein [Woeseia sp.]
MKKITAIMAGLALTGSPAFAAQEQETQEYDPDRDIATETERDHGTSTEVPTEESAAVQSEYGTEPETTPESDTGTDPYGTQETQSQSDTAEDAYGTESETDPMEETDPQTASTHGEEMGTDLSAMTSEELNGKSVITTEGDEIGAIDETGYSSTHQERVATVEVGGFLGVGEKRIAIPLSELSMGDDDTVQTSLTRESIEAQEAFDEAGFTIDE